MLPCVKRIDYSRLALHPGEVFLLEKQSLGLDEGESRSAENEHSWQGRTGCYFAPKLSSARERTVQWQPASQGGRNRAVPRSVGLVQRSVGGSYPASVLPESAPDPEAFTTKQHVWEPHIGGGWPHQEPLPWALTVPRGRDCPPSCWHPGPLGESRLPERAENSSRAWTELCAAATDSSPAKVAVGQTHVCGPRPCSGPAHCQVGEQRLGSLEGQAQLGPGRALCASPRREAMAGLRKRGPSPRGQCGPRRGLQALAHVSVTQRSSDARKVSSLLFVLFPASSRKFGEWRSS